MEHIVRRYLRENRLTDRRVLAAVSGGADSVALLCVLHALGCDVRAAHLNHCLRGRESARDEAFVRSLCQQLGVPLTVEHADVSGAARAERIGVEAAARRLRYAFLERTADAVGAEWIATAHTADDNLETVLFHLIRGTGAQGLAGIPPQRGRIHRPLLRVTREEVEAYLTERRQEYVTDSSNLSDHYTRNRIRHHVVPALREIAPHAAQSALRMSEQLRADAACLDALAEEYRIPYAPIVDGEAVIDRSALHALHGSLRTRVLRRTLEVLGLPMSEVGNVHLSTLSRLCGRSGETDLPDGWTACTDGGKLLIYRQLPDWDKISVGFGANLMPNGRVLTLRTAEKCSAVHNPFNTFRADRDKIDIASLSVRRAAATDRLEIPKYRGARSVRRLCDDCRVPRRLRRDLALLFDKNGPIAVEGIGLDRSREGDDTEKIEIEFGGS
ncbi:MAG: tRNA lysidine(34) synthetase TilS [Butyricicoccus sp.]|nr:tRNA lysidine(34) synthetase TilS [Butyricicoccus sp.]